MVAARSAVPYNGDSGYTTEVDDQVGDGESLDNDNLV